MDKTELKYRTAEVEPYFFTRSTMKFFGDTMANYYVPKKPVKVTTYDEEVECWELQRIRPVKHGLNDSAFFRCDTFERVFPAKN